MADLPLTPRAQSTLARLTAYRSPEHREELLEWAARIARARGGTKVNKADVENAFLCSRKEFLPDHG